MRIDGLEQSAHDPDVHCQNMQVAGDGTPQQRSAHSAKTQDHNLNGRSVFGCQPERSRVLVVYLVDVLVERTPMKHTMRPVVPGVLQHKEHSDLVSIQCLVNDDIWS